MPNQQEIQTQPLLKIQHLTVVFESDLKSNTAVNDISFELFPGETMALVGESGSGKSVTALSILGLLPEKKTRYPSGKILFQHNGVETDLLHCSRHELEKIRGNQIGFIFQEPMSSLNPLMTCGQQVAETLMNHLNLSSQEARNRTIQLFEKVKLPHPELCFQKYPHQISGGQKQRVMIAMAISCEPALLIADEPTTALDATVQKAIIDLLIELQQESGMALLFITHDLHLVKNFSDKTGVMYRSRLIESGPSHDVFFTPQEAYTRGLIHCRPSGEQRYKFLPTVEDELSDSFQAQHIDESALRSKIDFLQHQPPILELRNIAVRFPTKKSFLGRTTEAYEAVKSLSLKIHTGESLGLVGESGCGKTTTGKAIVGLVPLFTGEICYRGKDIKTMTASELAQFKREVQMVFQDPYSSLNPAISIGQAIAEPMLVHRLCSTKESKNKAIELLEKVGLSADHFNRYPHEFSGGQRQRICIARTLALQPRVIICDESVSALDVSVQAQVLNLLVSLQEDFGLTYLFISHDLEVVRHISQRIAVMHQGQLEEVQDVQHLFKNPQSNYTETLLSASGFSQSSAGWH